MKTKMGPAVAACFLVVAGMAFASGTRDDVPCALLVKFGRGTQVIPPAGKVQTRFEAEQPVICGSMVVTHDEGAWIRHANQTLFKVAPNSFFELGKAKADAHHLYRGEILMTAPSSIAMLTLATPNGEVDFKGGIAFVQYAPADKQTSVASFNRSFDFKNKFNGQAYQTVRAGEISRLMLSEDRIVPSQPVVMSPSSVKESLVGFEMTGEEKEELAQVVQRVFEARAKSLTTDIEDWNDLEKTVADRQIASVPEKVTKNSRLALDPEEAKISMDMLKKHLYGDDEDLKMLNDGPVRTPASAAKLNDSEYERKKKKKKQETERLIKEVSEIK